MTKPLPRGILAALFHPWTWNMAWRDSRSQRRRLTLFALSIVAGIAALTAIHSLERSVAQAVDDQAKSLLGSDLQVSARRPFTDSDAQSLLQAVQPLESAKETVFASMLHMPDSDAARLVQVRALDGAYPFYGTVETSPPQAWEQMRSGGGILLEPALLSQFNARIGDYVRLGAAELRIIGTVVKGMPRAGRFSGLAPQAVVAADALSASGLLGTTSLATYNIHFKLRDGTDAVALESGLKESFNERNWRFETVENRRDNLGDALQNFDQFLSILALIALVLGGIGVASAVHFHVARKRNSIAILRCLGCPINAAFAVYLVQAMLLALVGTIVGTIFGVALQLGTIAWFKDALPVTVALRPEWNVVARTVSAGFAICGCFALVPLLGIRSIPPGAALREGFLAESPRSRTLLALPVYLMLAGLTMALAGAWDGAWKRPFFLTLGLAGAFLVLAGISRLLVFLAKKVVRPSWPYLLRQGLSNLHRPQNQTTLFLLSLGLGVFLLLTVLFARGILLQKIKIQDPQNSPNLYLVDVQPDQLTEVARILEEQRSPLLEEARMITMRIASVKGVPRSELEKAGKIPRWALQREYRSTYRDHLTNTEKTVAGQWPVPRDHGTLVPISLEQDIAKDLGVGLGDEIVVDVQGIPIQSVVGHIREVDWSRFTLNFFMVFPTGVLESAPGFHVVTTRTPNEAISGSLQRELVRSVPNVSAIDLGMILETVRSILEKIGRVIQVLSGFAVVSGLFILAGTLLNAREQRVRESVLLRTLGASTRQVRTILNVEYAALGFLSAVAGASLSLVAATLLAKYAFKVDGFPGLWMVPVAIAAATLLALVGGMVLSRGVCTHPPLEILRKAG